MTALATVALTVAGALVGPLLLLAWDAWQGHKAARIHVLGPVNPVADALATALERHLDAGGRLGDLVGYTAAQHPSGAIGVTLILASDAAEEAEAICREAVA